MVAYCLHITDIDPLQYQLYFERFLNPERVSMPDIDMDFGDTRRGEVVDYVRRKYGDDQMCIRDSCTSWQMPTVYLASSLPVLSPAGSWVSPPWLPQPVRHRLSASARARMRDVIRLAFMV